jgi:hypothetical protein
MSMSPVIRYIYSHGSDEVIRRGKRIFLTQGVKFVKRDELTNQLHFRVRNDQYYNQYSVTVSRYQDPATLSARCPCPYNMGEICRHEAAALFQLNDMLLNKAFDGGQASFDQSQTLVRMPQIDLRSLRLFTSDKGFEAAEQLLRVQVPRILHAASEEVKAEVHDEGQVYPVRLRRNEDKSYETSCTCSEDRHPLCRHKAAVFLHLLHHHGPQYFDTIRNWDHQKNRLLALYGYSLSDDLSGKFEFYYQDQKPFLRVLDPTLRKVGAPVTEEVRTVPGALPPAAVSAGDFDLRLGLVINLQEKSYPYFSVDVVEGAPGPDRGLSGGITRVDMGRYLQAERYRPADRELLQWARKVQRSEMGRYLARHSSFGDLWENILQTDDEPTVESRELIYDYLHPKLLKLFSALASDSPLYILPAGKPYRASSLQRVDYRHHQIFPVMCVGKQEGRLTLDITLQADEHRFALESNPLRNNLLFLHNENLFLVNRPQDAARLAQLMLLQAGGWSDWASALTEHILPMSRHYEVHFEDDLIAFQDGVAPRPAVRLSEQGTYFIIKPLFDYDGHLAEWNDEANLSLVKDGRVTLLKRDREQEQALIALITELHPQLRKPEYESHFALHGRHALAGNWFFTFFDKLRELGVAVYGHEELKQFRIKRAKPNTRVFISSGQDWFDTRVEVDFEGQQATLQDIRKALAARQNVVRLDDGSYGLLPEEWLKRFSLLFKMGDISGGSLKVSKYNFSVIDEMYDLIDDEAVRDELMEKKNLLLSGEPDRFLQIPVPAGLQAELRPYQIAGFRWLCYLDSVKWGGLLADDMGLGKTIQTLAFLQHVRENKGSLRAVVVCPTTLIFNWENEINKFTPGMNYLIHHGPGRTSKAADLEGYDIILSTYGTLRSDIELFARGTYDYLILDESQTIKNPSSKVAKAVQLLPAGNRVALSGTPMQNNTFDIFSQMNFLNPGMLGSKEFFKQEFAKPVDKFQEDEVKQHLRRLIYPFLLRRTKEQVARDLPEKTEVTLYCEMGPEQRAVYELYRNRYRSQILGTIDSVGVQRSQFAILQGLMKLRQICDSPSILNDGADYPEQSVKLDELVRELSENVGHHKALVFSQFLGMLALIRKRLDELGIRYRYFDGSYTAQQREQAIRDFQENEDCHVFLISLKAGGMGLNLTAADYVYIVDPWWNPAVEQQAIDRTHRIGQTKNIFAYRMICRDTVEEKIMKLKEKKNLLVRDIVSDDQNIVKQLTRDDVQYLFS